MIAQQIDYFILTSEKKSKPQQLRILNSYASMTLKQLQQVLQFKKFCKNSHLTEERANTDEKCAADSQELGTSSMKKKSSWPFDIRAFKSEWLLGFLHFLFFLRCITEEILDIAQFLYFFSSKNVLIFFVE